jgi:hypothetical protein
MCGGTSGCSNSKQSITQRSGCRSSRIAPVAALSAFFAASKNSSWVIWRYSLGSWTTVVASAAAVVAFGRLAIREPGFLPPGNFSPSAFILSAHLRRPAIIAATTRALPSWVFGPVDMPPWNLQRVFPGASQCAAFLRHSTSRIGYRVDRKGHVRRSRSVLARARSLLARGIEAVRRSHRPLLPKLTARHWGTVISSRM